MSHLTKVMDETKTLNLGQSDLETVFKVLYYMYTQNPAYARSLEKALGLNDDFELWLQR